jgi:Ca2+-transporting ATPase
VGDRIPADVRLIAANSLEIDESALTGETRPARKNTVMCERGEGEDTHGEGGGKALGERHCMAFMGTLVRSGASKQGLGTATGVVKSLMTAGNGSGIVVGTGKDTEFGVIFSMMQDVSARSKRSGRLFRSQWTTWPSDCRSSPLASSVSSFSSGSSSRGPG